MEPLEMDAAAEARLRRGDQIIESYRRVFEGFTEEEMRILDGYDPEEFSVEESDSPSAE